MMTDYAFGDSWQSLALLASFLSVLVSIILLMVSRFFAAPKLEQTAKSEMVFAISTVVIVMFVIVVLSLAEDASIAYINTFYHGDFGAIDDLTVADVAIAFLNNVADCSVNILNLMYYIDIVVQTVLSIVMEVIMSELATGFFMNFFSERITTHVQILTFFLIIYYLIYHILVFLKFFGMFFFTLGVILRAFPPTRGAGAFIMSLCIGLYFVFPLSYVVMSLTLSEDSSWICDVTELPQVKTSTGAAMDFKKAVFENSLTLKVNEDWWNKIFLSVGRFINGLMTVICFLPFLSLVITLSFVLSTSSMFGATIPEVGKGLVKLI